MAETTVTDRVNMWSQGLVAGTIGYAIVVAYFALLNLATGRPLFHTAALLGQLILGTFQASAALSRTESGKAFVAAISFSGG